MNHKKLRGIRFKILMLSITGILIVVTAYLVSAFLQTRKLTKVMNSTNDTTRSNMSTISEETVREMLDFLLLEEAVVADSSASMNLSATMLKLTELKSFYNELRDNIDLYNTDKLTDIDPPDPSAEDTVSMQLLTGKETGKDLKKKAREVSLLYTAFRSVLATTLSAESVFVAFPENGIVFYDRHPELKVDENGDPMTFEVTEQEWYKTVMETKTFYLSDPFENPFTGSRCLVFAMPLTDKSEENIVAITGFFCDISLLFNDFLASFDTEDSTISAVINGNGRIIISNQENGILGYTNTEDVRESEGGSLANLINAAGEQLEDLMYVTVNGKEYRGFSMPMTVSDYVLVTVLNTEFTGESAEMFNKMYVEILENAEDESEANVRNMLITTVIITAIVLVAVILLSLFIAGRIVHPVERMTKRIREIEGDDIEFKMEDCYYTGDEINVLAESFATLSARVKQYIKDITEITAEKERIGTELELATKIQADMLPNIFPPYPDRTEFDIFASMTPAKEVGGDFYDFFLIDDDHLAMVMADVSGKGVPAALFMMMVKIMINDNAMTGISPAEVLRKTNQQVCRTNDEEMFVTVWFGILEISTGKITAANAGHEFPIIRQPGGKFELFRDKHGFVVGGFETTKYRDYEITLGKGGTLFLYTDGVAEATDASNQLFGTDRMLEVLNSAPDVSAKEMIENVKAAVDEFVGEAPQFDDLTALAITLSDTEKQGDDNI